MFIGCIFGIEKGVKIDLHHRGKCKVKVSTGKRLTGLQKWAVSTVTTRGGCFNPNDEQLRVVSKLKLVTAFLPVFCWVHLKVLFPSFSSKVCILEAQWPTGTLHPS